MRSFFASFLATFHVPVPFFQILEDFWLSLTNRSHTVSLRYSFLVFLSFHIIEVLLQFSQLFLISDWAFNLSYAQVASTELCHDLFYCWLVFFPCFHPFTFVLRWNITLLLESVVTTKWNNKNYCIFYHKWYDYLLIRSKPSISKSVLMELGSI